LMLEVDPSGQAMLQSPDRKRASHAGAGAVVDAVEMNVGLRRGVGEAACESKDGQERLTPVGQAALQRHTRLTLGDVLARVAGQVKGRGGVGIAGQLDRIEATGVVGADRKSVV